jgi:hypothetical protein
MHIKIMLLRRVCACFINFHVEHQHTPCLVCDHLCYSLKSSDKLLLYWLLWNNIIKVEVISNFFDHFLQLGLRIVRINHKHNVIYVLGQSIPGENGEFVKIFDSKLATK